MKLTSINTGYFKLDGGAMFGIVPRSMWAKLNPPDENNLCTWSLRLLLIETDTQKILVDTGIGDKFDDKFRSHFNPFGEENLTSGLEKAGVSADDITDVFLTHLHFDHVGGALRIDENGKSVPTFRNAKYWTNSKHYKWAMKPNEKEKASFLKENFVPLKEQKVLHFVDKQLVRPFGENISIEYAHGHTESLMMLHIRTPTQHYVYAADAMPSSFHTSLPFVMSYDVRPLVSLKEKESLLNRAVDNNWIVLFEHDPNLVGAKYTRLPNGRIVLGETFEKI